MRRGRRRSMDGRVVEWIDDHKDELVALLQALVRTPSVTGEEGAIQEMIVAELKAMGLSVDVWEPDWQALKAHSGYVAVDQGYEGRPNVVGTLSGSGSGRSLLLNGHVDVIPPGPAQGWVFGPWSGELEGERVHGPKTQPCAGPGGITSTCPLRRSDLPLPLPLSVPTTFGRSSYPLSLIHI